MQINRNFYELFLKYERFNIKQTNQGNMENREKEHHHHEKDPREDLVADSLKVDGKNQKRKSTKRVNNLWLWLGIIILIIIIVWWLFTGDMGLALTGAENG